MANAPLHILLADDDESDRLLFTDALKELKTNTIINTVTDGIELMNFLTKEGAELPQLLFLDLNMPRKNGFQCLKEIRSHHYLNDVVIAIFSTSLAKKDIEETFINGANVYINKPNNFNELKQALNTVVLTALMYENTFFNKLNFLLKV